jgi:AraC family transcriptional regulator of adaptative response/methylated-DNA-[protein]-cysteine methyltransferase
LRELEARFPSAELIGNDPGFNQLVSSVVAFIEEPGRGLALPLDVRGTAFQHQVWRALRDVPAGSTLTYSDVARRIGAPQAARAVAQACNANPVAVAIPCHRVIKRNGELAGYRWGLERKQRLLAREAES